MKFFDQEFVDDVVINKLFREYIPSVTDSCVAEPAKNMVKEFLDKPELHNPIETWNFCKELLDRASHGALFTAFEMKLFDFEMWCFPPPGSYSRGNGTLNNAPWRQLPPFKKV